MKTSDSIKKISISIVLLFFFISVAAQDYQANWSSLDKRPIPEWFENAKFGIFIHWGVYSVPSYAPTDLDDIYAKYAEWYWKRLTDETKAGHESFKKFHQENYGDDVKYQDFAARFQAEMYEPEKWAKIFKKAGAKYVVLTSKHHDGYTLWPSDKSWNWNAVDIGPHRDLAGDLSKAVKNEGLHMGFYYSLYEWFNPLYHNNLNEYVDQHMIPQMKDVVTTYQPDILWTDGEWDHTSDKWKSEEFLAWLYNESPVKDNIAVNDRWGHETRGKHGGYYTTEYGLVHEQTEDTGYQHPWEECRGIGGSFGYNRNEDLDDYSTSEELVHLLIDIVARGGNLLLNIGPTADGRIPVIMEQRLTDMGDWLNVNGEAIYGTRKYKTTNEGDIAYTSKGNDVYAIIKNNPGESITLTAPKLSSNSNISLLGSSEKLQWKKNGSSTTVTIPAKLLTDLPAQHAYTLKITGAQ